MKLRLHAGTLRLRLGKSEIAMLAAAGRVEEAVTFAAGQTLVYALEAGPDTSVTVSFEHNRIRVGLPAALAKTWVESDVTGLEGPSVLIEKDFQCVHPQGEDDADGFPNPLMALPPKHD